MSLFSTIHNSAGALRSAQIGLQTVGNNIANANTDGYIRQNYIQTTPAPSRYGQLIVGHGVRPVGIVQQIDQALAERMWDAGSHMASGALQNKTLSQLSSLLSDLDGTGLNDELTALNGALHDLANEPNDASLRQVVVLTAESLTLEMNRIFKEATRVRADLDAALVDTVDRVNDLGGKIAALNLQISTIEGGRLVGSDATGLRDDRYRAIEELSQLIDVNVQEQATGTVSIFVSGDYLVSETYHRELKIDYTDFKDGGEIRFSDNNAQLRITGGELYAIKKGRNTQVGEVLDGLNEMASSLARQFNLAHSQGQGERGFDSLTSSNEFNPQAPLSAAGLAWTPDAGAFDLMLVDAAGKRLSTHRIDVRLGDPDREGGSSIETIAADISQIDGLSAEVMTNGKLKISSDLPGVKFTFGGDTSGFVAAAGLNTFFVGAGAESLAVNSVLQDDPNMLATSRGGIGNDTEGLAALVDLIDADIASEGGISIRDKYGKLTNRLTLSTANQKSATQGLQSFYATLQGEHLAITGVNMDEESLKMITYQRAFQAASRVIATASEMLELLTSL